LILADSGFWVAIFDDGDNYHTRALQVAKTLQEPLISTTPVITEVCYLLQKTQRPAFSLSFFA